MEMVERSVVAPEQRTHQDRSCAVAVRCDDADLINDRGSGRRVPQTRCLWARLDPRYGTEEAIG